METKEKKSLIEALLFVSGEPLSLGELKNITELPEVDIKQLLDEMILEYKNREGGLFIQEIANGYQMATNPEYAQWIKKIQKHLLFRQTLHAGA